MATTNYSWNLPTVGAAEDTWGTSLNANWTALDTLLGGVSQTEFAILDGATVSTAELNLLDGVTWTLTDYNALTATATELNLLDGITALTGADTEIVTGTAGTDGQIAQWNADGDVVGYTIPTQNTATWEAGTDTTDSLVSAADVRASVDQGFTNRYFKSSTTAIANNGSYSFTHGLGGVPDIVQVYLQCTTAEHGYSIGDIIQIAPTSEIDGLNEGNSVVVTSSAIEVRIGENGPAQYTDKDLTSLNRIGHLLTASRWDMYVVAVKF